MSYLEQEAKAQRKAGSKEICKNLGISEARLEQVLLGMFVVRVVSDNYLVLEAMVEAGVIEIHRQDEDGCCFDILPPADELSLRWSERVAKRLTLKGWNAVRAPRWSK